MDHGWPAEIDFNKFPGGMISGLSLSQINKINTAEDSKNTLETVDLDDINDLLNDNELIFDDWGNFFNAALPSEVSQALNDTEMSMKPKSSLKQEKLHSSRLVAFLKSKNIECQLESVSEDTLNSYLRWFYHELRTSDGGFYSPSSLKCIRAGIHRFLTQTYNRKINIITDDAFASANRMLITMTGLWLSHGGQSKQFIAIEEDDLKIMYNSFDRQSGESLQNEFIFSILYFLGARGREELKRLKRNDISFEFDSKGTKFMVLKSKKDGISEPNNTRKNVKASLQPKDYTSDRMNRIYDQRAVECIEMYLNIINRDQANTNDLFPRPLNKKKSTRFFSEKQVRGEHYLGSFMKTLSSKLKLSKVYSNHCIRCTTITKAKENGLTNSEVCIITGHKDQRSIDRYDRPSDERKQLLSSAISLPQSESNVHNMCLTAASIPSSPITINAPTEKKMRIDADGNSNIVTITFI